MLILKANLRKDFGKKIKNLQKQGFLAGILYGPKIEKSLPVEVDLKEFEKIYKKAGESSLISLEIGKEKYLVLINEIETEPLSQKIIHVDFYQPKLDEETEADIPLIFEGEAPACKDLGGTLVKNIHEVEVSALPQNLPHEIKVNIEKLKTFEDAILIKDLIVPKGVKILKDPEEIVVLVTPQEDFEEELKKPIAVPEGEPRPIKVGREEKEEETS